VSILIVIGFVIVGWVLPEFFVVISPKNMRAPIGQNIWMAIAFGLIAAGVVYQ
jgi:hypothetical protein